MQAQAEVIYGSQMWGLDAMFWSNWKLFVGDILSLERFPILPNVFRYGNRPVMRVQVLGYVVSVDQNSKFTAYNLDDGTGIIRCVNWYSWDRNKGPYNYNEEEEERRKKAILPLGTLAFVHGRLSEFRGDRQITISFIAEEPDLNAEILWWLDTCALKTETYDKPLVVQEGLEKLHLGSNANQPTNEFSHAKRAKQSEEVDPKKPISQEEGQFYELIREMFQEQKKISFATLRNSVSLIKFARHILSTKEGVGSSCPEDTFIYHLFTKTLKRLVFEGIIYQSDEASDTYELISTEFICQTVCSVLEGDKDGEGLSNDEILSRCMDKEKTALLQLNKTTLAIIIERLVDNSDIVEVGDNLYQLV